MKEIRFEEIREKREGEGYETKLERPGFFKYAPGHVFDDDKSVKWNREKLEEEKVKHKEERAAYDEDIRERTEEWENDIISALVYEYRMPLKAAELVFRRAYREEHSNGLNAVEEEAELLAEFSKELVDAFVSAKTRKKSTTHHLEPDGS